MCSNLCAAGWATICLALFPIEEPQTVENDQQGGPNIGGDRAPKGCETDHRQHCEQKLHGDREGDILPNDGERGS